MAQCLVSVVCLAVLPTVQSMQVLSLCKDHCMIVQLLAYIMLILGQCYNIQKRASICKETMNVNKICLMMMMNDGNSNDMQRTNLGGWVVNIT